MVLEKYNVVEEVTPVSLATSVEIDASEFKDERVALLFVIATVDASAECILEAGVFSEGVIGSMAIPVDTVGQYVCAIETARFKDADGNINISVDTMGTLVGTVSVIQLP